MADNSKEFKIKVATEANTAELAAYNAELSKTVTAVKSLDESEAEAFSSGSSAKIDEAAASVEKLGEEVKKTEGAANDAGEALKKGLGKDGTDAALALLAKMGAVGLAFEILKPVVQELAVEIGKALYGDGWEEQLKNAEASAAAFGKMSSNLTQVREQQEAFQASVHDTKSELDATLGVYTQIAKQFENKQRREAEVRASQAENDKAYIDDNVASGVYTEEEGRALKADIDEQKRLADHRDKIMTLKNEEALLAAKQEEVVKAGLAIDKQKTEAIERNKAAQQVAALESDGAGDEERFKQLSQQKATIEKTIAELEGSMSPIKQALALGQEMARQNVSAEMSQVADRMVANDERIKAASGGISDLGSADEEQKRALQATAKADQELEALKKQSQDIANRKREINPTIAAEQAKFALNEDTLLTKQFTERDKREAAVATREDDATAKGFQGANKAGEKELISGLQDLGKAIGKDTTEGKKAAEEIKNAVQSLADGGTSEELAQVASVLEKYGDQTDRNVSSLLAIVESNTTRAEALESRIKSLETKVARNSALAP